MSNRLNLLFTAAIAVVLLACGGGGSSSGSANFAGIYNGIASLTTFGETTSGGIQILINADRSAISDPGTGFEGTGRLNGNNLIIDVPGTVFNDSVLNCIGSLRFDGTLSENRILGTVSTTSLICNEVRIPLTGTFSVSRASLSRSSSQHNALDNIRDIINESL